MTSTTVAFQVNITIETEGDEDLDKPWVVQNLLMDMVYRLLNTTSLANINRDELRLNGEALFDVSNVRIVSQAVSRSIPKGMGVASVASLPLLSFDQIQDVWNGSWRYAHNSDPDWDIAKSHKNLAVHNRPSHRMVFPTFSREDMLEVWREFVKDQRDAYWDRMKPAFRKLLLEHIDGMVEDGIKDPAQWRAPDISDEEVF